MFLAGLHRGLERPVVIIGITVSRSSETVAVHFRKARGSCDKRRVTKYSTQEIAVASHETIQLMHMNHRVSIVVQRWQGGERPGAA